MNNVNKLIEAGYNPEVAEALDENSVTPEQAKLLSAEEVFSIYLEWNGIIGYAHSIMGALDNARSQQEF